MLRTFLVLAAALGASSAYADEVIIQRDAPVVVEPVPPPPPPSETVIVKKRLPDCATTRTHTEDEVTGSSETVTRRDCD